MASIVKALEARSGSAGSEDAEVIGEIERLDQALRERFERLEAESDLAKRREMAKEIGPYIGALDSALSALMRRGPTVSGRCSSGTVIS